MIQFVSEKKIIKKQNDESSSIQFNTITNKSELAKSIHALASEPFTNGCKILDTISNWMLGWFCPSLRIEYRYTHYIGICIFYATLSILWGCFSTWMKEIAIFTWNLFYWHIIYDELHLLAKFLGKEYHFNSNYFKKTKFNKSQTQIIDQLESCWLKVR